MLPRSLAVLPLLAAVATAQVDRQIVHAEYGLIAQSYGLLLVGQGAMTSSLTLTPTTQGPLLGFGIPAWSENLVLLFASGEARLSLLPAGIDGWLLVDPVWTALPMALGSTFQVPPMASTLWGNDFYLQSIAWRLDAASGAVDFSFSHGLLLRYYRP